jgi:hypothetical protein
VTQAQCNGSWSSDLATCQANAQTSCESIPNVSCQDTDGGRNLPQKGTLTRQSITREDSCGAVLNGESMITVLHEYYCDGTVSAGYKKEDIQCTGGTSCQNGACVSQGGEGGEGGGQEVGYEPAHTCTDIDGGVNVRVKGGSDTPGIGLSTDVCADGQHAPIGYPRDNTHIFETACVQPSRESGYEYDGVQYYMACPSGTTCSDGACQ